MTFKRKEDLELLTLFKRQVQVIISNLLLLDVTKWNDPTPLPEFIEDLLQKSWRLGDKPSYLDLFRHYVYLLEANYPFNRIDIHLQRVLTELSLSNIDFIRFADIRILGLIKQGESHYREVENLLQQAWALATTPELKAQLANREGVFWREQAFYRKSEIFFKRSLRYCDVINNARLKATVYNNLGNWAFAQDFYDKALDYYQQALQIATSIGYLRLLGAAAGGISITLEAKNHYDEAYIYSDKAKKYYQEAGFLPGLVRVLLNRCYLDSKTGALENAKKDCSEALRLARQIGDLQREATALHNFGLIYAREKDWDNAFVFFKDALTLRRILGQPLLIRTTIEEIEKAEKLIRQDSSLLFDTSVQLSDQYSQLLINPKENKM